MPFGPDMTEADVDRILSIPPFSRIDASAFSEIAPLRGVIRYDCRITRHLEGDIVAREGEYGNSAFFVISGAVQVVLNRLPDSLLGHKPPDRKGLFSAFAQLWRNPRLAEVRAANAYAAPEDRGVAQRESEDPAKHGHIYLQDVPNILDTYTTVRLAEGEFFGEIAALGRTPRVASVFSEGTSELLEISWQGLRELRQRAPEIKDHIDTIYRERGLSAELWRNPVFTHLEKEDLNKVIAQTEFETFGRFEWFASYQKLAERGSAERLRDEPLIASEGSYANGLMIIRGGFARVSQAYGSSHRTISYLGRGQSYGLDEIVHNWREGAQVPFQNSLRALGYVDVLFIPTSVMETIVLPHIPENALNQLVQPLLSEQQVQGTKLAKSSNPKGSIANELLEFLVENRFINGTATMIVDTHRCVACDDCVRACAMAHDNNPRFIRHGLTFGHHMIANACMHCADPVCMIGCPTGAISRRTAGQVVINDITCIGCATCANNCPYNNIRMVQIRNTKGTFVRDDDNRPITKATKCDLCVDQLGGPACQRACPHDALRRVNMFEHSSFAKWLNR